MTARQAPLEADAREVGLTPEARRILRHRLNRGPAATFTAVSCNRKLSPVLQFARPGTRDGMRAQRPYISTTFAAIAATCPDSCQFKRDADGPNGCFADAGLTRLVSVALNKSARDLDGEQVIAEECREIDLAFHGGPVPQDGYRGNGRDLRLHVGGDAPTVAAARALGAAATRWRARGGGAVWSYTHNWRHISRVAWGPDVAVLASCDTRAEMDTAHRQGYAPAIVVPEHKGAKSYRMGKWRVVPCPAETRDTNCANCRLCLGGVDLHRLRMVIAFSVHGKHSAQALVQLGAPPRAPERRGPNVCTVCLKPGHNARRHKRTP